MKICIRKGINNIYTDPVTAIETGQNGYYQTPELEAGNYCLEISSENDRYMSSYFNIKVFGNMSMKNQNMSISASLKDNQMRVVLTWGARPQDLDSHLDYSLSNGKSGHIFYREKESVLNNVCIAKLDVDDVDGYGPEQPPFIMMKPGTIHFMWMITLKETVWVTGMPWSGCIWETRQSHHIHLQYRKERAISGQYLNKTVRSADSRL